MFNSLQNDTTKKFYITINQDILHATFCYYRTATTNLNSRFFNHPSFNNLF